MLGFHLPPLVNYPNDMCESIVFLQHLSCVKFIRKRDGSERTLLAQVRDRLNADRRGPKLSEQTIEALTYLQVCLVNVSSSQSGSLTCPFIFLIIMATGKEDKY